MDANNQTTNLNTTQVPSNPQPQPKIQPDPGTLTYQPSTPETIPTIIETTPESTKNVEEEKTPEILMPQPKPTANPKEEKEVPLLMQQPKEDPAPTVVDQTKVVPKLHHIQSLVDKLTTTADEEEEEFIKEVETVHGHK